MRECLPLMRLFVFTGMSWEKEDVHYSRIHGKVAKYFSALADEE